MTLPDDFYRGVYDKAAKRMSYSDEGPDGFVSWARQIREKLSELLRLPAPAENPDVEVLCSETCDGFVREKIVIKNGLIDEIPAYVLIPDTTRDDPAPGIVCLHGHGGYYAGKDMVAGITDTNPIAVECADALNYGYGVQLARAGFVTICPDAFNFGERLLKADRWAEGHICDKYFVALATCGLSPIGVTTAGNMQAIDYLLSRPEVCGEAVGCVGLSFGRVQAVILACVDRRVAATVVSGALSSYARAPGGRCGAQAVPGMLQCFDRPDKFRQCPAGALNLLKPHLFRLFILLAILFHAAPHFQS